jgi:glucose-1-phosphate cytidylyltransferase
MKVVILAGGFGTRIPIGPYPILWHIMKYYASFGHHEFVLCLGHKGNVIREFFLNYEAYTRDVTLGLGNAASVSFHNDHAEADWKVTLAATGFNAMTGARIARIARYVGDDDFMLTYGDGVGDVDLDALVAFHKHHGKILTVTGVRPPGRFGELRSQQGAVTEFNEKPQATGGRISGGFFVANRRLFDYLNDDEDLVFEQVPMRRLVADGNLMMFEHDGFWQPMDTSREYQLLNALYEKGEAPWVRW